MIGISEIIVKENPRISLDEENISYTKLMDKLAAQTNSKWRIDFGKGVFINFIHKKDKTPATIAELIIPNE